MENKDGFESDYAEIDVYTDQVRLIVIANNFVKRPPRLVVIFLVSPWTCIWTQIENYYFENDRLFQITITERAAYEDLLVYWEYGDCYYQIEELEKYAVMSTPEDISEIPDIKT